MKKEIFLWMIFAVVVSVFLNEQVSTQTRQDVLTTKQRIEAASDHLLSHNEIKPLATIELTVDENES